MIQIGPKEYLDAPNSSAVLQSFITQVLAYALHDLPAEATLPDDSLDEDPLMVEWLIPGQCWPPHAVTHPEKVDELVKKFKADGWGKGHDALVGYVTYGPDAMPEFPKQWKVQLLSGSHRWEAARIAQIRVPVVMVPEATIEEAWGDLAAWRVIMNLGKTQLGRRI